MLIICILKSAWFIWPSKLCPECPIRTAGYSLSFPSLTWSIMMVYRNTVLSFTLLWFLTTGWLSLLTLHRIHFRNVQTSSPRLMKAHQIWDRAGSRLFFFTLLSLTRSHSLSSSVDNSQMWPLQDKVHVPQGREKRIKNCGERKHVRWVSATCLTLICGLSFCRCWFLLWFLHWT